ncbi:preprotein translocase subunit SecY, partial [Candidatus Margulisiibacteriota bacterium]
GGLLGLADLFSGGALSKYSIFALGIIPYINASIIFQLLTFMVPSIKELMEEGESGRKKVQQYIRYLTVALATVQGFAVSVGFKGAVMREGFPPMLFIAIGTLSLVAGSVLVMWLGELITENGIGNGASMLIFMGIVGRIPLYILQTYQDVSLGGTSILGVAILLGIFMLVIIGILIIQEGQRRIPVQYAKKIVGNKMYGAQSTYIPLKINQGGVIPIIFASSVLLFPTTIGQFYEPLARYVTWLSPTHPFYWFLFFWLIFFFTYFYTAITFNPVELADNIRKYGGFVLGIRPGKPTAEYLERIISRLTLVGAVFLGGIAIIPMVSAEITNVRGFTGLGGTALLIMVGVALDFIKQIRIYLVERNYEGLRV